MIVYFAMSCKVYVKEAIRFVEKRILNFKLSYLSIRRNGNDYQSSLQPKALNVEIRNGYARMKSHYI